jgi:formylglycine-generating enzyme required for sulfatase activity
MDTNPSYYDSGSSWPVDQVNWFDAALFCNKLSKMAGLDTVYSYNGYAGFPVDTFGSVVIDYSRDGYRLPTEAEYEYAYRAGTTTDFYWGRNYPPETTGDTLAIDSNAIWFADDTINSTFPVALKKPNAFGLYDMAGDVFEWCNDWYAGYSSAAQTNPTGPAISTGERVQRGGLFGRFASGYAITYILCSWCRNSDNPADYQTTVGFRVVRGAH